MKTAAKRAPTAARKIIVKKSAAASKSSAQSGKTVVVRAVAKAVEAAGSGQATWSTSVSLESLRKRQDMFAKERDWDQYHTPRNLALAMVGEVCGKSCDDLSLGSPPVECIIAQDKILHCIACCNCSRSQNEAEGSPERTNTTPNSDILRTERLENCASVSSGGLILQLLLGCLAGVTPVSNSAKASYVCVCVLVFIHMIYICVYTYNIYRSRAPGRGNV